jgi:hypothetical protein
MLTSIFLQSLYLTARVTPPTGPNYVAPAPNPTHHWSNPLMSYHVFPHSPCCSIMVLSFPFSSWSYIKLVNCLRIALPRSRRKRVKVLLYPLLPRFSEGNVFLNVTRLRPFVLLVRVACRRRWVWSIGGMILTCDNRSTRKKNMFHWHFAHDKSHTELGSNPGV